MAHKRGAAISALMSALPIPAANSSRTPSSRSGESPRSRASAWVLVMPEGERPHPGLPHRHRCRLHDAADHDAVGEHVEVVVVPSPDGREAKARLRRPLSCFPPQLAFDSSIIVWLCRVARILLTPDSVEPPVLNETRL
jgi:hypothetical protein